VDTLSGQIWFYRCNLRPFHCRKFSCCTSSSYWYIFRICWYCKTSNKCPRHLLKHGL